MLTGATTGSVGLENEVDGPRLHRRRVKCEKHQPMLIMVEGKWRCFGAYHR